MATNKLLTSVEGGYTVTFPSGTKYFIAQTDVTNILGKGAFGIVYKATSGKTAYALKQISKNCGLSKEQILIEISFMNDMKNTPNSANVIYSIDYAEDSISYYIIIPFYDKGTLTKLISNGQITSEVQALEYFRQICFGMKQIHGRHIIHRDLKTDNVLACSYNDQGYDYNCLLAIADLGLASEVKDLMTKCVGTKFTMAPEVDSGLYDQKADVYSLGCILYKMLTKEELFYGHQANDISEAKKKRLITVKNIFQTPLSKFTLSLLEGCLQYDKNKRLSIGEIDMLLDLANLYSNYKKIKVDQPDTQFKINLQNYDRKTKQNITNDDDPKKEYKLKTQVCKCDINKSKYFAQSFNKSLKSKAPYNEIKVPKFMGSSIHKISLNLINLNPDNKLNQSLILLPINEWLQNISSSTNKPIYQMPVPIITLGATRFAPLHELLEFIATHQLLSDRLDSVNFFGHNHHYLNGDIVANTMHMYSNTKYDSMLFPISSSENEIKKLFGCLLYICLTGSDKILYNFKNKNIIIKIGLSSSTFNRIMELVKILNELFQDNNTQYNQSESHYLHDLLKLLYTSISAAKDINATEITSNMRIELPLV